MKLVQAGALYKDLPVGLFFENRALILCPRLADVTTSAKRLQVRHVEGVAARGRVNVINLESCRSIAFPTSPPVPVDHGAAHPAPAPAMQTRDVPAAHETSPR